MQAKEIIPSDNETKYVMKKFYAIFTALTLFSTVAKAQQTICGWVTDEQRSPIEYANVIALSVRDSSLVTGAVTDNAGKFLLSLPANSAQVFLRVSGIGYEQRNVSLPLAGDTLLLKSEAKAMEGVTVTAQRPKMAIRNDALVTTIVGSSLAKAGSGNDVLKHIPLLTGKEGSYSVVGRGAAVIYINNRKITDATEIERLNSSDIKDIEVIKNFKNLKEIYIPHNKIKDLTSSKSLEFLEYILLDDKISITEIKKILPKRLYKNAKIYTDDAAYLGLIEVSYEKGEN